MRKLLLILLFAIASCTEPLTPSSAYCVQYRIGEASTTSAVEIVDGNVTVGYWKLFPQSTPNGTTILTRKINKPELNVNSITTFEFPNNHVGDTIRGICIQHTWGNTCNTTDTLPVWFIKVPCKQSPTDNL